MLTERLDKPGDVNLTKMDARQDGGLSKEEGAQRLAKLAERLAELQELLYAAGQNALLVVLQGRDTSGKDGTLKAIAGAMNPVGVSVASFKPPTQTELLHDFLWRVHEQVPPLGHAAFFNRSHYEDILVARVRSLVPEKVWKKRYAHINDFEELLSDSGVIVVKFFLNISKEEQEERLLAREQEAEKAWKINLSDWEDRAFWDDYTAAYEDALGRCVAPHAPWFIVPADRKWFRNIAVAEALVETLHPYEDSWRERLAELGATQKAAMETMRRPSGSG